MTKKTKPKSCITPGCKKKYRKCGFCGPCYYGWITHGDPLFRLISVGNVGCKVPDCEDKHHSKGYCRYHYKRYQRYGHALRGATIYERHSRCNVAYCRSSHGAKGFCDKHYKQWVRNGYKMDLRMIKQA